MLLCVVVGRGAAPLHAVSASVRRTVCVVATVVEVRELTQSAIGVPAPRHHDSCGQRGELSVQRQRSVDLLLRFDMNTRPVTALTVDTHALA